MLAQGTTSIGHAMISQTDPVYRRETGNHSVLEDALRQYFQTLDEKTRKREEYFLESCRRGLSQSVSPDDILGFIESNAPNKSDTKHEKRWLRNVVFTMLDYNSILNTFGSSD